MLKRFLNKVLFFDEMLTPKVVTVFYFIAIVACLISGLQTIFAGSFFGGIGYILMGLLMSRILAEVMYAFFEIHASLKKIAEK